MCALVCMAIMCTRTTMARGGSLLMLLTLAWSGEASGLLGSKGVMMEEQAEIERTVVVEIQDVNQPYNCSAFFDSLEVGDSCHNPMQMF